MDRRKVLLLSALLILITGGCSIHKPAEESDQHFQNSLPEIPSYIAGEYFTYDNGRSKMVKQVQDNQVTWQVGDNSTITAYADFTLPPLNWSNPLSESAIITNMPATDLWPLKLGTSVKFSSVQTIIENKKDLPREVLRKWECSVKGTETVQVPVGEFNTFKITCNRYSGVDNSWRGTISYYYSPEIGHNVLIKSKSSSRSETTELTDYGFNSNYLPNGDKQALQKAFYNMLNTSPDGVAEFWQDSTGKVSLLLVPTKTFHKTKYQTCRGYRAIYSISGRLREHTREYCKLQQGEWKRVN